MVDGRRRPAGVRGVARGTVCRETVCTVDRVRRRIIVRLVAGDAVRVRVGIVARGVALGAVLNVVAKGQWEKVVVDGRRRPARA